MKKYIFMILALGILFLNGCTQTQYVCPDGTVVSDATLCPKEETLKPFDINLYVTTEPMLEDYEFPSSPTIERTISLGLPLGAEYSDNVLLYIYVDGLEESKLLCKVEEYYDSVKNDEFVIEVLRGVGISYGSKLIGYEADVKPKYVRYDAECTGIKSGLKAEKSFHLYITYE